MRGYVLSYCNITRWAINWLIKEQYYFLAVKPKMIAINFNDFTFDLYSSSLRDMHTHTHILTHIHTPTHTHYLSRDFSSFLLPFSADCFSVYKNAFSLSRTIYTSSKTAETLGYVFRKQDLKDRIGSMPSETTV